MLGSASPVGDVGTAWHCGDPVLWRAGLVFPVDVFGPRAETRHVLYIPKIHTVYDQNSQTEQQSDCANL